MNDRVSLSIARLVLPGLVALLTIGYLPTLAIAGGDYRCPFDTQTCLDKMVTKLTSRGWLGIEYNDAPGPEHMKITRVVPGSPAESAGFRVDDVLVSVEGARFSDDTEDECVTCEKAKGVWKPGGTVRYVVQRGGELLPLSATLASLPSDVLAMMIGMHMLEHARP